MATKRKNDDEKPLTVTVIHPDGFREYEASTPRELNDLVAGYGYRIKSGEDLTTASQRLVPNVDPDAPAPATATRVDAGGTGGGAS